MIMTRFIKWTCLLFLTCMLTGCFSWIRAYQTYQQMDEFDKNFGISLSDEFIIHFKHPILYSDDFNSLSKVQPSSSSTVETGISWRYWFQKIDKDGTVITPETKFYFNLMFDLNDQLTHWSFSPLFLQIAPAEFLEISLRSIAGAKIDSTKRQLKADTTNVRKISVDLPQKTKVISKLGQPLKIEEDANNEIYYYHFLLDTANTEDGYEDRRLTVLKLYFDKQSHQLVRMTGRFIGLKISINYQKYLTNSSKR